MTTGQSVYGARSTTDSTASVILFPASETLDAFDGTQTLNLKP
jgi:hypothetical protein